MKRYFLSLSLALAVTGLVQSSAITQPQPSMNQQDFYRLDQGIMNIKQQQIPGRSPRTVMADKSQKQGQWQTSRTMVA